MPACIIRTHRCPQTSQLNSYPGKTEASVTFSLMDSHLETFRFNQPNSPTKLYQPQTIRTCNAYIKHTCPYIGPALIDPELNQDFRAPLPGPGFARGGGRRLPAPRRRRCATCGRRGGAFGEAPGLAGVECGLVLWYHDSAENLRSSTCSGISVSSSLRRGRAAMNRFQESQSLRLLCDKSSGEVARPSPSVRMASKQCGCQLSHASACASPHPLGSRKELFLRQEVTKTIMQNVCLTWGQRGFAQRCSHFLYLLAPQWQKGPAARP